MSILEVQLKINNTVQPKLSRNSYKKDLIVSELKLDDGKSHVLSYYGDPVWELPFNWFPTTQSQSERRINFSLMPECFQETTKTIIYRYMREGRNGFAKPRGGTIKKNFYNLVPFFKYLSKKGITKLSKISTMVCMTYVNHQKNYKKINAGCLEIKTIFGQLHAVELLHEISQNSDDIMPHPWPESSAKLLAGATGSHAKEGKTKIIPENILTQLFSAAAAIIEQKETLLTTRNQLAFIAELNQHLCKTQIWVKQTTWLEKQGHMASLRQQTKKCDELRDACMIIILTLSGCRAHELAYINNGSVYNTQDNEGNKYFWMRSTSTKTYAGKTEWLIPELAKRALEIAECWAQPLQKTIQNNIAESLSKNANSPKIEEQKIHQFALFLGHCNLTNTVSTLSGKAANGAINRFAQEHGIDWHFTEHQFRRTFAVAVARSAYGDLRYLREHFKHWSLDMTTLYALNEKQEEELYDEIMVSIQNEKIAVVEHWLDDNALITGGGAQGVIEFKKKNSVKTYQDRKMLANTVSELVHIRATGHGWCLADDGGCGGRGLVDKTRCVGCNHSVIDDRHTDVWHGIHAQQKELMHLDDIGEAGKIRVKRDLERCEYVLKNLGALDRNKN